MTRWTIEFTKSAAREYRDLEEGPKRDAAELMADLTEDPYSVPAIELRHIPGNWRARFHHDRYRLIYQIAKARKHIIVTRVRPRPIAYEGMKNPDQR